MAQTRKPLQKKASESTSDRTARHKTIAEKYSGKPSPRALSKRIEWHLETIPKKPTAS